MDATKKVIAPSMFQKRYEKLLLSGRNILEKNIKTGKTNNEIIRRKIFVVKINIPAIMHAGIKRTFDSTGCFSEWAPYNVDNSKKASIVRMREKKIVLVEL